MKAYQCFQALKLHFNTDYDYFKYNGKTRQISESSFTARNDYHQCRRIERRYGDELRNFILSNMVYNEVKWIGDLVTPESEKVYRDWKRKIESLKYNTRQELMFIAEDARMYHEIFRITDGGHPKLLKYYLGKKISIETLIVMNEVLEFLPYWTKNIRDTVIWPDVKRLMEKYRPFLTIEKSEMKALMREIFLDNSAEEAYI